MPVTAKLSRKFYETFGEDITNELVELLNNVHTTSRGDLRELNESNFTRFDGKLAEMNGRWEGRFAAFDAKLEQRLAEFDAKLVKQLSEFDTKLVKQLSEFRAEITERLREMESRLAWKMFAFWAPTAFAVIASGAGVISLLLHR